MAINTNTSKSMAKASNVLGARCENTEKNMKKLMADAGCKTYESENVRIPNIPGSKDDVVFVGLNGVSFYFLRGKSVNMPKPLVEILTAVGEL